MNGVRGDMNIEALLRKFKKVCERSNVLTELKNRRHFEKPCEERRRKKKDAIRKYKKDQREQGKRRK